MTLPAAALPDHVPVELVRDVDYTSDPDVLADPYAAFDRLRDEGDILWSPRLGGCWIAPGAAAARRGFPEPGRLQQLPHRRAAAQRVLAPQADTTGTRRRRAHPIPAPAQPVLQPVGDSPDGRIGARACTRFDRGGSGPRGDRVHRRDRGALAVDGFSGPVRPAPRAGRCVHRVDPATAALRRPRRLRP